MQLAYGMSREFVLLLWLPIVTTGMSVGLVYCSARSWRRSTWSAMGRVYYSLVTLAALAFVAFLLEWNLLGFRY